MSHPETGRTFKEQSSESYCLECVEGHSMRASTEVGHAIDRFRTAGKMTEGVTEKVRNAIEALQGIPEDVKDTKDASPEVKKGLDEILDKVRWIRKNFGITGGLTRGEGTMEDLEELQTRITAIKLKAYKLVEECPTCKINREEEETPEEQIDLSSYGAEAAEKRKTFLEEVKAEAEPKE